MACMHAYDQLGIIDAVDPGQVDTKGLLVQKQQGAQRMAAGQAGNVPLIVQVRQGSTYLVRSHI